MIKALIFDFDGLILDTEGPDYQSWQELYREYGFQLPMELWSSCIGLGTADSDLIFNPFTYLEELLGQKLNHDQIRAQRRKRYYELIETRNLQPGVKEYLEDAKKLGLKLGVASSSSYEWVSGHLTRLGVIGYFESIKNANDLIPSKPEPDVYLAVLQSLNVKADQVIAFEDSPNGILAAKRAGLYCMAVPNPITGRLCLDQADLKLTSLVEMPLDKLLEKLNAIQGF